MRRLALLMIAASFATLPATAQTLIGTVPVGNNATYIAPNPATNKLYVTNFGTSNNPGNSVTVIDGATDATSTITVGSRPEFLVINSSTNKIYVNNRRDSSVSVINGATNTVTKTITGFSNPVGADVIPSTNKIFVANSGNGTGTTVSVIDGATDTIVHTVTTDNVPFAVAANPVTNKIYVVNECGTDNNCASPGTVTVIDGSTYATTRVTTDYYPAVVLVNSLTNKIYVLNVCGNNGGSVDCLVNGTPTAGTVTVIDGATNQTSRVNVGNSAGALAVNQVTNEAYVANGADNTVTFINGATLATTNVTVGNSPADVEVNSVTNKVYVTNYGDNTISMIDGQTHHVSSLGVGNNPAGANVNIVTNRYYAINITDGTVSAIAGGAPNAVQFIAMNPCRLIDTRGGQPLHGGTTVNFTVPQLGGCNIPATASAYSLNVTVVPQGRLGYLSIWPTGAPQPVASTMNSPDGRNKANAAIVPGGYQGAVSVYVTDTTNLILDINGYFIGPGAGTLQFYPLTPCRVVDTRNPDGPLGGPFLSAGVRNFPVETSHCIPSGTNPVAYSMNFTAIPYPSGHPLGYLTVWPEDGTQPQASTLNNPTATNVANAAIVQAGTGGGISVYVPTTTNLAIDINGYFAAPGNGGLSFYRTSPCRVADTRQSGGAFTGVRVFDVEASACTLPGAAAGYVLNATVVPQSGFRFLTLWPDGVQEPGVSTLNAVDGYITSNMAIVPTNNGKVDADAAGGPTQLILDISGYFAP